MASSERSGHNAPLSKVSQNYFKAADLAGLRREIEEQGFAADELLATDPDCPVFGFNLACAYPFPPSLEAPYTELAGRLAKLDEAAYVYPLWETHITIATFINFNLHRRPAPERLAELRSCVGPTLELMKTLFDKEAIKPFRLEFQPPVLTRKAAILPVANPTGEIARIRQAATRSLEGNKELHQKLLRSGLTVPGIIHSTIMRLKKAPRDPARFAAGFDTVAAATAPLAMIVRKILFTVETKPYMRQGEILHRFSLT